MTLETIYFVQSFNAGRGNNLKAGAPMAPSKLDVVAFSSTGDPEMGDYDDEPTVIFRIGKFPSAFDSDPGGDAQRIEALK